MFWCFEKDWAFFLAISFFTSSRHALSIFSRAVFISISLAHAFLTLLSVLFSYPSSLLILTMTSSYLFILGFIEGIAAVFARLKLFCPVKLNALLPPPTVGLGRLPRGMAAVLGRYIPPTRFIAPEALLPPPMEIFLRD
jgi:hypothetical protein